MDGPTSRIITTASCISNEEKLTLFHLNVLKPILLIKINTNGPMKQSEFKANTCSRQQAKENAYDKGNWFWFLSF